MNTELKGKRILVIANKYYSDDTRLIRQTEALVEGGYLVDLICPRNPAEEKCTSKAEGRLRFHTLPMRRKRSGKARYVFEYLLYFLFVFVVATVLHFRHRHKVIHVYVMPEFLVLTCIIPKMLGSRILMDWMDPMREVYLAKFEDRLNSFFLTAISFFEKIAILIADHIITPNEGFQRAFSARGAAKKPMTIVMNSADERIFRLKRSERIATASAGQFNLLFSGTIVERAGLDLALRALAEISSEIPDLRFLIVGAGEDRYTKECMDLTNQLSLTEQVEFRGRVSLNDLSDIIQQSCVSVIPNRRTPFTMINFPTRIMEYAALKTPMIVPRFPGIEDYLDEKSVFFFEPDDHKDLARSILELYQNSIRRDELAEHAFHECQSISWEKMKIVYLEVIEMLCDDDNRSNFSISKSSE